jgi:ADP-L-glycero-D-manno-heptose 6-epimerase
MPAPSGECGQSHRPDYADGEQCRDFIYVKDCAAVMLWLFQSAVDSGILNVGSGQGRSCRQLMEAVGLACGVAPIIEYVETPPALRSGYQYFTKAMVGKLRAAGYTTSFTPLKMAVSDFVTEYLAKEKDPYL